MEVELAKRGGRESKEVPSKKGTHIKGNLHFSLSLVILKTDSFVDKVAEMMKHIRKKRSIKHTHKYFLQILHKHNSVDTKTAI